jgi:hypothetical protein
MSFFGITALGPPSSFQAGLVSALGINVFSVEEFEATFRRLDKDGSGAITADEVEDLLHDTYGFPPLEEEVAMFMDNFDLNKDGKVTWEEFKNTLERIRAETNKKSSNAKEYTSYEKMRADRFKHIRMGKDIPDKYKVPMTSSQAHGFYVRDEQQREISKVVSFPIH